MLVVLAGYQEKFQFIILYFRRFVCLFFILVGTSKGQFIFNNYLKKITKHIN